MKVKLLKKIRNNYSVVKNGEKYFLLKKGKVMELFQDLKLNRLILLIAYIEFYKIDVWGFSYNDMRENFYNLNQNRIRRKKQDRVNKQLEQLTKVWYNEK